MVKKKKGRTRRNPTAMNLFSGKPKFNFSSPIFNSPKSPKMGFSSGLFSMPKKSRIKSSPVSKMFSRQPRGSGILTSKKKPGMYSAFSKKPKGAGFGGNYFGEKQQVFGDVKGHPLFGKSFAPTTVSRVRRGKPSAITRFAKKRIGRLGRFAERKAVGAVRGIPERVRESRELTRRQRQERESEQRLKEKPFFEEALPEEEGKLVVEEIRAKPKKEPIIEEESGEVTE